GCPEWSTQALGPERLDYLCRGECYNPSDARLRITRIEIVRIRPQAWPGEPVGPLIEDPWRRLDCPQDPAGCVVEVEDPDFLAAGRDTLYYARAIQEPTPAVNAGGLRCRFDESGSCVEGHPCWGDSRAPLRADDYTRSLDALERDRRGGAEPEDRRFVLDRLIDEELLVQRGLELGLARQDARVRRDLTAAVIDAVVTEHEDGTPPDADVEAFYRRERDFFARPGRLRVRQLWCRADTAGDAPSAEARARAAAASLRAGEDFAGVRARLGDPEIAPLPDALLSPAKLLDHLGPTALRAALGLEAGAVSDPVRSATGYH